MNVSSADFLKLTLQEVADMLLTEGKNNAECYGLVDDQLYKLHVELVLDE